MWARLAAALDAPCVLSLFVLLGLVLRMVRMPPDACVSEADDSLPAGCDAPRIIPQEAGHLSPEHAERDVYAHLRD